MRKVERFEAHLDDYNSITVYLSKRFYQGKSESFFLREPSGKLSKLIIKSFENTSNEYSKYMLAGCDSIMFGVPYVIVEEHSLSTPLQIGLIVKSPRFDQEFYYPGNDLGAHVNGGATEFVLWAPTAVAVKVQIDTDIRITLDLKREEKGVYRISIPQNLHLAKYKYLIFVNGKWIESIDPYGRSSTSNASLSVVIDDDQCLVDHQNECLPILKSKTDAIIVECSVRDFTMDKESNNPYPGTFKGFITRGTMSANNTKTGFDYLCSLNVSHIQLMPVFDFATVDEENVSMFYNWGYDPIQYNVPEGSFSSDPHDPLSRVMELKELISQCHKEGMRVIMDVVYNHVYDMDASSFEKIVPYYFFRRSATGAVSNGSFCDNDFDSNRLMARKYIVDSCKMWVNSYGVDGFRFDLMGIIDVDTMNLVEEECQKLKPDIMIYGEGWNMPTILDDSLKAMMFNQHQMPNIGHFNDFYRDHVKGKTSENEVSVKGYCTGDVNYADAMKMALIGNTLNDEFIYLFDSPQKSINYVECHDNRTAWDKIKECCKEDTREIRIRKHKLMIGALMVSQGTPFFQIGQEFCRTKNGVHNSYRSSDYINQLDWLRKDRYHEVVQYTKDMIKLRKQIGAFRLKTTAEIRRHVYFEDLNHQILVYGLKNVRAYGSYDHIRVFFNPTNQVVYHRLEDYADLIANEAGLIGGLKVQSLTINPNTMVVVGK
jgi:pullulanase